MIDRWQKAQMLGRASGLQDCDAEDAASEAMNLSCAQTFSTVSTNDLKSLPPLCAVVVRRVFFLTVGHRIFKP